MRERSFALIVSESEFLRQSYAPAGRIVSQHGVPARNQGCEMHGHCRSHIAIEIRTVAGSQLAPGRERPGSMTTAEVRAVLSSPACSAQISETLHRRSARTGCCDPAERRASRPQVGCTARVGGGMCRCALWRGRLGQYRQRGRKGAAPAALPDHKGPIAEDSR